MLWSPKGERMFWADSMDCVDRGKKPDPADAAISDIHAGQLDYRLVRITGVISSVVKDEVDTRYCWSTLCTSSGNVFLALYGKWNDPDKIRPFVDAEVSVMGLVSPISGLRQHLGREISVGNEDEIVLLRQPSPDPFAAPELSTANTPHRRRASGVVLAVEPTRFFILTPQQRLIPVIPTPLADQPIPSPNDLITASGFSSRDPYRIQLSDALVRIDGHATNKVRILMRPIRSLFIDEKGSRRIDTHADGRCIAVRGTATIASPDELRISDGEHAITLETATLRMLGIPIPPDGSRVSASALCNCEFENPPTPTIYPTFKRFTLIPRNRNDLVILEAPPWWTPFRLTVLVLILTAILLGSTAWNVMLKRKSEKRGKAVVLTVICEAMGHINFGLGMEDDRKGVFGKVTLGGRELTGWKLTPKPLTEASILSARRQAPIDGLPGGHFRGAFAVEKVADTFLDLSKWSKGVVYVNGHNLGRYWKIGPQYSLYCPAPFLEVGENQIDVIEMDLSAPQPIRGVARNVVYEDGIETRNANNVWN